MVLGSFTPGTTVENIFVVRHLDLEPDMLVPEAATAAQYSTRSYCDYTL
jgi:hypothetical protein